MTNAVKSLIKVPLTLEFKDVTTIRFALGKIKCASERQARELTNLAEKLEAKKNAEYLSDLEKKLYTAQWNSVTDYKRNNPP